MLFVRIHQAILPPALECWDTKERLFKAHVEIQSPKFITCISSLLDLSCKKNGGREMPIIIVRKISRKKNPPNLQILRLNLSLLSK